MALESTFHSHFSGCKVYFGTRAPAQAQELGSVPSGGWSVLSLNQNHLCEMTGRHKKVPEPQNSTFGFGFLATKEQKCGSCFFQSPPPLSTWVWLQVSIRKPWGLGAHSSNCLWRSCWNAHEGHGTGWELNNFFFQKNKLHKSWLILTQVYRKNRGNFSTCSGLAKTQIWNTYETQIWISFSTESVC